MRTVGAEKAPDIAAALVLAHLGATAAAGLFDCQRQICARQASVSVAMHFGRYWHEVAMPPRAGWGMVLNEERTDGR
jgi:hypothetical protein